MTSKSRIAVLIISISLVIISCGTEAVKSRWADDLNEADWRKSLKYFEDEKISIAAINNDKEIQIFIASAERARIMQFLSQGFTAWIQKESDNNDMLGIKYPVKKLGNDPQKFMVEHRDANAEPRDLIVKMINQQNEFLLVNENDFPLGAYPLKNELGIEPTLQFKMSQLVYSIRIPLNNNDPDSFEINYLPGEIMNINFEIEVPERDNVGRGSRGNGMRGGGRAAGGRMGGGDRSGTMNKNRPEPIDLKLQILLAAD
ncbi:MAG: hypothetical protein HND52_19965 [Ignavibacteriae bacterium]|nr:hypothetical protein [Ignavibacteriota bacterium]NOH00246.1 hypothetical protein [Ignavibacteriota bacterium]